ncbi:MAG: family N-acetyltransferase [Bacilli bacterium]|nr:family N-acetyltransferase [Bacilli bacterium]
MAKVVIDEMKIENYDNIALFWKRNFGKAVSTEFDSKQRIESYINRNPGISSVAVHDGEIVGSVLCGHDGRRGTFYHVAVDEEFRGKGIAHRMIERSSSLLKQEGIDTAVLFAHTDNIKAVTYWKKNGWTSYLNVLYHFKDL